MCTNIGGRGGSSGLSGGGTPTIKQLDIPKNESQGISFDASKLQGTSSQIKYAQDIIDRGFSYADTQIEYNMTSIEAMMKRFGNNPDRADIEVLAYRAAETKALIDGKNSLQRSLGKATKASGIIKNKRQVENVFPDSRESSKDKYYKEYLEKYKKIFKK